jgi:cyclophilin family peptidyl-prolyl cis-trans isomerase
MKRSCLLFALALVGCPGGKAPDAASGAPAESSSAASVASSAPPLASPEAARLDAILTAEHQRNASPIGEGDLASRDASVRRAAARALSRIGGDAARPGLLRLLGDEDRETVAWAAYGLGFFCKGNESANVAALVARGVALRGDQPDAGALGPLDVTTAIARAIGKCAAEASEPSLVAWLAEGSEVAAAASLGLGDYATAKEKLREETIVALLNAAAGSAAAPPVPAALYPIGRLEHPPVSVIARVREVATQRLAAAAPTRFFAVRALGRGGPEAAKELSRVLTSPQAFDAAERAEAARSLKRLGEPGRAALFEALTQLAPSSDPIALTGLVGDDFGVLLATLDVVDALLNPPDAAHVEPSANAKKALSAMAKLPMPPSAPAPVARRVAWVRCSAARALAGNRFRDEDLLACDVTADAKKSDDSKGPAALGLPSGTIGARAVVTAIGRAEITGPRLAAFEAYARFGEVRAREQALELVEDHEEIEGSAALLASALEAKEGGVAATAADVIGKQPARAADAQSKPKKKKSKSKKKDDKDKGATTEIGATSPAVLKALAALIARPGASDDPEIMDSVIDAIGAVGDKDLAPRVVEACRAPYPTTREHAEKALALLGTKTKCAPPDAPAVSAEVARRVRTTTTITLDTDVGPATLTLDPALAPAVVTRVVELVRSGYYDGMVVHRVVPGFVTQFGAPEGDGFGGPPDRPALRCETSPLAFAPLTVGVALAGRDTGSSQLFVMHARQPHLDGQYAFVGTATGPWASFADGDRIKKATASP